MSIALLLLTALGIAVCGFGIYFFVRIALMSRDNKPVMVSFILQRDDCSRLLGEFGEKHLPNCSKLVIIWKNGSEDVQAVSSRSLESKEAMKMLLATANEIGRESGIKTAVIL